MNFNNIIKKYRFLLFKAKPVADKEQIIDSIYVLFSLLIIPAVCLILYKIYLFGFKAQFVININIAIVLIIAGFFRRKIKYSVKLYLVLGGIYLIGVMSLLFQGTESLHWIFFFLLAVFVLFLYNLETSIFSVLISLIGILIIRTLHKTKIVEPLVYFKKSGSDLLFWVSYISELILCLGLILYFLKHISNLLDSSLQNQNINGHIPTSESEAENSHDLWKVTERAINIGIMDWNIESGTIILSEKMRNIFDLPEGVNMTARDIVEYVHRDDKNKFYEILKKRLNTLSNGMKQRTFYDPVVFRLVKKNGANLFFKEYGILYYKNSKPVRYVSAIVDNMEFIKSVKRLNQQKKHYNELIDAIQNCFLVLRGVNMENGIFKDFVVLETNHVFLNILNKKYDEVFEKTISSLLPQLDEVFYTHCSDTLMKNHPVVDELYSKDLKRYLNITYQKIKFKSLFLIIEDITEKKMMRNKIIHSIIYAEEKERSRISKEIHDGIGPLLSTLKMFIEKYCNTPNLNTKKKIEPQLYRILDEAISNVSTISNNLSPKILENFGLKKAIKRFVKQVESVTTCSIEFSMNTEERFESKIEISVYRTLIEIINNSIKHSNPSYMKLTVSYVNKIFVINFSDNGKGFDFNKELAKDEGQGLKNIINRLESLGGTIEYLGNKNTGVIYHIQLPV